MGVLSTWRLNTKTQTWERKIKNASKLLSTTWYNTNSTINKSDWAKRILSSSAGCLDRSESNVTIIMVNHQINNSDAKFHCLKLLFSLLTWQMNCQTENHQWIIMGDNKIIFGLCYLYSLLTNPLSTKWALKEMLLLQNSQRCCSLENFESSGADRPTSVSMLPIVPQHCQIQIFNSPPWVSSSRFYWLTDSSHY